MPKRSVTSSSLRFLDANRRRLLKSPRLYPGALVWCARKPGRELREKVEVVARWQEQGAPLLPHSVSRPSLGNCGRMT